MTTWIPPRGLALPAFFDLLDQRRLGAQQGPEGLVILRANLAWLQGRRRGYQNHPAAVMWRSHERALAHYLVESARAWNRRGWRSGTLGEYLVAWQDLPGPTLWPPWWGRTPLHEQHPRSLVARDPEHYGPRLRLPPWPIGRAFAWPPDPTAPDFGDRLARQIEQHERETSMVQHDA